MQKETKTYVILGLGIFGSKIAKELYKSGQEVVAIDKNMEAVERIQSFVTSALCLDYTDINALKKAGIEDFDVGIVSSASQLEQAIIGVLNLKELNIEKIVCKVRTKKHQIIMEKIGVDQTIIPDKQIALRLAKKLVAGDDIVEYYNLEGNLNIFEGIVKNSWIGKSIIELDIRSKLGINIVGVKSVGNSVITPEPNYIFKENDHLYIVGSNDSFEKYSNIK